MKYQNPWPPVSPQDEKRYDIEMKDGTTAENVEYWAFGGGFKPSEKPGGTYNLVEYRLEDVVSFSLANTSVSGPHPSDDSTSTQGVRG
jgi:hypothetical protein